MELALKDVVEAIWEAIDKYKNEFVLVEGKKDKRALELLGFQRVYTVNINKPLYEVAESINEDRIIILTDLDKKGKEIYSKIKKDLDKRGVLVDDSLRNLIFQTELRQIEGLAKYLNRFSE